MEPKLYQVESNGKFTTINAMSAGNAFAVVNGEKIESLIETPSPSMHDHVTRINDNTTVTRLF